MALALAPGQAATRFTTLPGVPAGLSCINTRRDPALPESHGTQERRSTLVPGVEPGRAPGGHVSRATSGTTGSRPFGARPGEGWPRRLCRGCTDARAGLSEPRTKMSAVPGNCCKKPGRPAHIGVDIQRHGRRVRVAPRTRAGFQPLRHGSAESPTLAPGRASAP